MNCSIENCNNKIYARGWCRRHYRHVVEGGHAQPLVISTFCKKCSIELEPTAKSSGYCRKCYYNKWLSENKDDVKKYSKAYREANKEKISTQIKTWKQVNKQHTLTYYAERRKDPKFRLIHNLRSRLYDSLKGKTKNSTTLELTGCSQEELMSHIEAQFEPEMTWDNYGSKWVIDHIKPLCSLNIEDPDSLKQLCHYTNLRPLWYDKNCSKASEDKRWKS